MYSVVVKDHIMIAHSLPDPFFGPAQNLHGATYVIEAHFMSEKLNEQNVVLDIGLAHQVLKQVLEPLAYQNLDELEQFQGQLTTTEFVARHIHDQILKNLKSPISLKIILHESNIASASYES